MTMIKRGVAATLTIAALLATGAAWAAEPAKCKLVRMSDPGWSDISSTNALLGNVLKGLGYDQKVDTLAVPVTYKSVGEGIIDVFLGNWMPAQKKFVEPLIADGKMQVIRKNLADLKFTLAVPTYVAEGGVRTVEDLAKHADKFGKKIYGIEPGAPVNQNMQAMIKAGDYGLGGWDVVESSEQAMLAQVDRAGRQKNWIVFVGWEPHPMNTKLKMTYLSGGEKTFGANYGASEVYTVARKGLTEECPNLARLLAQTSFTVNMENEIMASAEAGKKPEEAALAWLKANPTTIGPWLEGVTTFDGRNGASAVKAALGL
jgi:glycine betaine/proline transport system substrate-binding protein